MIAGAIVSLAIVAGITSVLQVGTNFATEQVQTASMVTAQQNWAQDAANASWVTVADNTSASFYEIPNKRPSVYTPRGDDDAHLCRKSTWLFVNGAIRNTVEKFTEQMCDLDNAAAVPVSKASPVNVIGAETAGLIEATNAAGRDLHFAGNDEIGLAADSARPSENVRASWWRDYEWEWPLPADINLNATIKLPISGDKKLELIGTTGITPSASGSSGTGTETDTPTTPVTFDPGPVTGVAVARSTTAGAIYGGVHEGIRITFNEVTCGPYTTEYTVDWTTTTPGANPKTTNWTAAGAPVPVDFDGVPNGSAGTVTVTAACPAGVSPAGPSTSAPENYTQSVPDPGLTAKVSGPATTNIHDMAWNAVTSLPASYQLQASRAGAAFATIATVPSTSALVKSQTWPAGSNFGVDYTYRIVTTIAGTNHTSATTPALHTAWPVPATPGVTFSGNGRTNSNHSITVYGTSCPAGTGLEIDVWNSRTTAHRTLNDNETFIEYATLTAGSRYYAARAHCIAGGNAGPWSGTGVSNTINVTVPPAPIPAQPSMCTGSGRWNAGFNGGGVVRGCFGSVAGATSYQYYARYFLNSSWVAGGTYSTSSAGTFVRPFCTSDSRRMSNGGFYVRAGNATGWSSWRGIVGTRDSSIWTCT